MSPQEDLGLSAGLRALAHGTQGSDTQGHAILDHLPFGVGANMLVQDLERLAWSICLERISSSTQKLHLGTQGRRGRALLRRSHVMRWCSDLASFLRRRLTRGRDGASLRSLWFGGIRAKGSSLGARALGGRLGARAQDASLVSAICLVGGLGRGRRHRTTLGARGHAGQPERGDEHGCDGDGADDKHSGAEPRARRPSGIFLCRKIEPFPRSNRSLELSPDPGVGL